MSIAGVAVSHPVEDVTELWFGEFALLWKPEAAPLLTPGTSDPGVAWLRRSLADIDGRYRADPLDSEMYDSALVERVREFQRDHRIVVDGYAGRQTQIIINSQLGGGDRPRLVTSRLARD